MGSDELASLFVSDRETLTHLQTFKGWFFVATTAAMLYALMRAANLSLVKAQNALAASEKRYRTIGELIPFGVWVTDRDGNVVYLSDSFLEMLGMSLEECRSNGWVSRLPPETAEKLLSDWQSCLEGACFWDYEFDIINKDGDYCTILSRGVPLEDDSGSTLSWVGINVDITQRKKVEEALRESEEKHRALIEASSDGIFVVDRKRRITSCNQAFLDLFGYEKEEMEGMSAKILHPSETSFLTYGEKAYPVMESGKPFRTEWEYMRKDGSLIPLEGSMSALRASDGSITGFVGILRDITDRRKSEAELIRHRNHLEEMVKERTNELEAAQKALIQKEKLKTLGAISAEVAHEIRNPLVSIGGFAKRLQKKLPHSPEVDIILSESSRLEGILDRIKNYLKPIQMQPEACVVNSVVEDTVELLSPELTTKNISWSLKLFPCLAPAYVDPAILREILVNVIKNSMKLMDGKGTLSIKTFESERSINISFRNPAKREKVKDPEVLFMPFEEGGQGVGLPLSYRLLKEMGGLLTFTDEGNEVVFTVSLIKLIHSESTGECKPPAGHGQG